MQKAVIFKIKKDKLDEWKKWCEEISTHLKEEAVQSILEEKIIQETTFCFEINGEFYGLGFMDGEGLPANPERAINIKHKEKKSACIEFLAKAEVLYNIKAT